MIITRPVGIVSYGTALPSTAIPTCAIEEAHHRPLHLIEKALGVKSKTVPALDEDSVTLATAATYQALRRVTATQNVGVILMGSESHPYAVKPSSTMIINALGLSPHIATADLQFACKAGTQAFQLVMQSILSGFTSYGIAIGSDIAQGKPGDMLEYTASAGAASYLLGDDQLICKVLATTSYTTDIPDFWRRTSQAYPSHAERFTGEPAYMEHIYQAAKMLLQETSTSPSDVDYVVFHTPNKKFPQIIAKKLGFHDKQLKYSLVVEEIGNTYAAAVPLALAEVLDHALANEKIFVVSYGSGAGSDAFLLETTPLLSERRPTWTNTLRDQIQRLQPISYTQYRQHTQHH